MKASIITSMFFSGAVLAAPTLVARQTQFTLSLSNDASGASVIRSVPTDGIERKFSEVFRYTGLEKNGRVVATSVQNVNPVGSTASCNIHGSTGNFVINDQTTFVDLDGKADGAVETDVSDFTISCSL